MTALDASPSTAAPRAARRLTPWALTGSLTGLLGIAATLATDLHPTDASDATITADVIDDVSRVTAHVSVVLGYLAVVGLLVLSAQWRRHVEPRTESSTAARLVTHGLVASSGTLALGYGYKGMLAIYMDGGVNEDTFDRDALYMMFVLNDFGSFIGWLGVVVAAGAVAWMALKERTISRWIGVWSLLPVLAVTGILLVLGVPGFPGVVGPLWMLVAFTGLAFGRSPVTR